MTVEAIRVLIADDHPFFRDGLRMLLDTTADTELVGEAENGDEAVGLAGSLQPDVILMDLRMPGLNGIEATRRIVADSPHIAILVVTMYEDDASVFAAMQAGARGYLLKGADKEEMLLAIRVVRRGDAIFGPAIARRLIQYFAPSRERRGQTPSSPSPFPDLTEREWSILALIAAGRRNQEIADELCLTLKTVRNYVSNVFSKLQVADRVQAALRAREAGL